MLPKSLNRIISYGIVDAMGQSEANRIKRINIYYLCLSLMLLISSAFALVSAQYLILIRDAGALAGGLLIYFLVPPARKPDLNSLLGLLILVLIFISAYFHDSNLSPFVTLAILLIFPLVAVSVNGKSGKLVSLGLGLFILVINSIPGITTTIHLDAFDAIIFLLSYGIILIIGYFIERSNRLILDRLKKSHTQFKEQLVERDEFMAKLSHKLRTSLSNITLINNLVHDSRLSSQQMELMETLQASTNSLIEDVNNIVEIVSPGKLDFTKSIISFEMAGIIDEAVEIIGSGKNTAGDISVEYMGQQNQALIGDPGLLRRLVINLIKGIEPYLLEGTAIRLRVSPLKETPSHVRLEFGFKIKTVLGRNLSSYLAELKSGHTQKESNLSRAYRLLQESESVLKIDLERDGAVISFFQDFAKDAVRSIADPGDKGEPETPEKKAVLMEDARVLLVEDNLINQKIVLLSLNKKVKQIDVAGNGKIALEMFGLKQYDIVLMDIMMPVMDGLTATKKIREIESTNKSHIPIITITANALSGDRDNCLAAGADDYIAKPFQSEVLVRKMKNLLA